MFKKGDIVRIKWMSPTEVGVIITVNWDRAKVKIKDIIVEAKLEDLEKISENSES